MKYIFGLRLVAGVILAFVFAACGEDSPQGPDYSALPDEVNDPGFVTTSSGLRFRDITVGDGAAPSAGQTVVVHYTGWLVDGTRFDSSIGGQPFSFVLGVQQVIDGWDEGVASMKVGGKRRMVIPSKLAYGSQGAGGVVPPNATLIFEVELLEVR